MPSFGFLQLHILILHPPFPPQAWYLSQRGEPLLFEGKGDMCNSLDKLLGRPVTEQEEEQYMDDVWRFLATFDTPKTQPLLERFNHSISTDGYSVSVQLVTGGGTRGKKEFVGAAKKNSERVTAKLARMQVQEFERLDAETSQTEAMQELLDVDKYVLLACDPGKKELLAIGDGRRKGVLTYTKRRRDRQSGDRRRLKRREASRRATLVSGARSLLPKGVLPTIANVETKWLAGGGSSNSSVVGSFDEYVRRRLRVEQGLSRQYHRQRWRADRFQAFCRRRSADDRLVHTIQHRWDTVRS